MANLSNINNKFIVTDGNNGRVLIGATNDIGATLFANHPSTTAPSLTFNAPAGQVFENEDLQIAFGLNNASPYNGYMQTRFVSAPYYRNLSINPLGGNLGVGTNSPSGKITSEAAGNHLHLRANTAPAGKYWNFDVTANNQLYIITDGNNGINITNTGYVGIGTVTNTARLNVGGKLKITDDLIMAQTNGRIDYDNGVSSGALRFFSTSGNTERMRITSGGDIQVQGGDIFLNSGTNYNDKGVVYLSNERTAIISDIVNLTANGDTSLDFQTRSGGSRSSAMLINEFRDVLMGNTVVNPASGFASQKGFGYDAGTGQTQIATTDNASTLVLGRNNATDGSIIDLRKESNVIGTFGSNTTGGQPMLDISANATNGNMRFLTANVERMRINATGNVLIGNPSVNHGYKLQIEGNDIMLNTENSIQGKSIYARYSSQFTIQCDSELRFSTGGSPTQKMVIQAGGNVGLGNTIPYSRLDLNGVLSIGPASLDPSFTVTSTDVSTIAGGSLELVQGFGGTTSAGDTIVFTYEAQSWKAFQYEYCISAAYGLSKGGGGGYNNNGMTSYYYVTTNQGSNVNVTSVASNSGGSSNQYVIVTITGIFGIHPCVSFKYTQSGGDGAPRADRATLAFNS
jgi:hypothetical protein